MCILFLIFTIVFYDFISTNVVNHESEFRSGQIQDYEIGVCCFHTTHATLKSKVKDRGQDNVSECSDMSTNSQLITLVTTIKSIFSCLCWSSIYIYKADIIISSKCISPWYSWSTIHFALNNNRSFSFLNFINSGIFLFRSYIWKRYDLWPVCYF
jgi:hypothetical protein